MTEELQQMKEAVERVRAADAADIPQRFFESVIEIETEYFADEETAEKAVHKKISELAKELKGE